MKQKIYELIDGGTPNIKDPTTYKIGRIFDYFISTLIVLNILAIILESVASLRESYQVIFNFFEWFSVFVFMTEYLLRCYVAGNVKSEYKSTMSFVFSFYGIIDILAILPTILLGFGLSDGAQMLRQLRIFRLIRIIKLTRYNKSMDLIFNVIHKRRKELMSTLCSDLSLLAGAMRQP